MVRGHGRQPITIRRGLRHPCRMEAASRDARRARIEAEPQAALSDMEEARAGTAAGAGAATILQSSMLIAIDLGFASSRLARESRSTPCL